LAQLLAHLSLVAVGTNLDIFAAFQSHMQQPLLSES
jgi:hypothetical protein